MEIIATAGLDGAIIVWDISSGDIIETLKGSRSTRVCFSPCGTLLVAGSEDGSIILWDCQTWTRLQTFNGCVKFIKSVSFNRTSDRIVSTSFDCTARVWSVATGMEELNIQTGTSAAYSASFNDSGDTIAVTCDKVVNLYDAHTGELKQSLAGHASTVYSIRFSHDGRMLASGSNDYKVVLWDVASGSILRELRGHTGTVTQLCFNADASRIVSSSCDSTARIWDVSTGVCLFTLCGHQNMVNSCCFSEDGSKVITGSNDGTVGVWDSDTGEQLRTHTDYVRSVSYRPSAAGSYI